MNPKTLLLAGVLAVATAGSAWAHHAAQAEFDVNKNVTATGTLTRMELINPHSYMYFNIKEPDGTVHEYSMETVAPVALKRAGLSIRDNMKVGQTYKLIYSPARNGTRSGIMTSLVLPTGQVFGFGSGQQIEAAKQEVK